MNAPEQCRKPLSRKMQVDHIVSYQPTICRLPKGHDGLCSWRKPDAATAYRFAVNGQPTTISVSPETPLDAILMDAILQTENERWGGVDRWEVVTTRGQLLDGSTPLRDLTPNERGVHAFIQLKPGVGA